MSDQIRDIIDQIKSLENIYWGKIKEKRRLHKIDKILLFFPSSLFIITLVSSLLLRYFQPEFFNNIHDSLYLTLIAAYLLIPMGFTAPLLRFLKQFWRFPNFILWIDIEQLAIEIEVEEEISKGLMNYNNETLQNTKHRLNERVNQLEQRINLFMGDFKGYGALIYLIGASVLLYAQFVRENNSSLLVLIIPAITLGMIAGNIILNFIISRYKHYIYLIGKIIEAREYLQQTANIPKSKSP